MTWQPMTRDHVDVLHVPDGHENTLLDCAKITFSNRSSAICQVYCGSSTFNSY